MLHSQSRISQAHPQIERIIEINEPTVEVHVKQRIKQKLIQDAEFLLQKKKKQQEKRDKMRKVEEDLERQRQMKLRMIIEKKNKSERVMEMNRDAYSKKIKQQQDYFNQVLNVHKTKEERDMQDALIRQKQLKKQLSKSTVRSKHEKTLTTLDATFNTSQYNQKQAYFDRLSQQLQQKSLKAIRNHQKQTKQIIDRMKQKSENITTVQQKANNISLQQKMQNVQKWNKKVENIESFHEQTKLERQKKLLQRRQSFKYKLDKCNQNLQQLSFREQEKYEKLQEKLEKQNMEEKEWRDSRLEKYWKLWEENSQKIQEQKRQNAERILHKHQQITEQNRVYKSRKEKLIQVVKKIGQ